MTEPEFIHPPNPPNLIGQAQVSPAPGAAIPVSPAPMRPHLTTHGRLADPTIPHDQRTFVLLMHVSIALMQVMFFFSFLVPLVMWLSRRERSPFINDQGREVVNFHLSIMLYALVSLAMIALCWIGVPLLVATYILAIVGGVAGCLAASRAEYFRYPMCVRFLS